MSTSEQTTFQELGSEMVYVRDLIGEVNKEIAAEERRNLTLMTVARWVVALEQLRKFEDKYMLGRPMRESDTTISEGLVNLILGVGKLLIGDCRVQNLDVDALGLSRQDLEALVAELEYDYRAMTQKLNPVREARMREIFCGGKPSDASNT